MADAQKQMEASETEVGPIDPANLPEGVTFAAGPPSSDGEVTGGPAAYYWSGGAGWRIPTGSANAAFRADFDSSMNVESVSISPGYSGINNTAGLQAFDSQGNLIGSDSADLVGRENPVTLTVSGVGQISHILAGTISPITSGGSWVSLGELVIGLAQKDAGKKERVAKFQVFKDKAGEYRWRLRALNNEIIADSGEGYKEESDCRHGLDLVKQLAPDAEVVDQT